MPRSCERVTRWSQAPGCPCVGPALGADRYLALMRLDKKAEAGEIRFVVIESPGRAGVRGAPEAMVRDIGAGLTARAERRRR
jgi:3-dehydroquinate synthase